MVVTAPLQARRCRVAVDVQALFFMRGDQLVPIPKRLRVVGESAVEAFAAWRCESNGTVVEHVNLDVAFMHLPMMEATLCRPPDYAE